MSAQPVEPFLPGRVRRVPRTIKGICDRLPEGKRAEFLAEVMAAQEEDEYEHVLDGWWAEAHFAQVPDREERRAEAIEEMKAGKKVSLAELQARWRLRSDDTG